MEGPLQTAADIAARLLHIKALHPELDASLKDKLIQLEEEQFEFLPNPHQHVLVFPIVAVVFVDAVIGLCQG